MCIICVDFQKQKMTPQDARRALREMRQSVGEAHAVEVAEMIEEAEAHNASASHHGDDD